MRVTLDFNGWRREIEHKWWETYLSKFIGAGMTTFETMQKDIWESTKRQAALVQLCIRGCDWLSDDGGVCVSSTGCMYTAQDKDRTPNS